MTLVMMTETRILTGYLGQGVLGQPDKEANSYKSALKVAVIVD